MKQYKLFNIIFGWTAFLIAAVVYLMTIEPTASFWDCGEFIASAYKLEVGHPPGAPLFMLLGRFFTLFAGSPDNAAMMVNILSALASAFTIMFLFWSITHLSLKIVKKKIEDLTKADMIRVFGSGLIGALVYTFSDTFWFSAVEAEVYATSSLFTAVVFWAILKWENESDKRFAHRWIILIAYLIGLSIGVHLLNLLAIPAIVFVYYFKKNKPTVRGIILAAIVAVVLLGSIMYIIIPGAVNLASKFELLFVNGFGMPYNSGIFFYLILLVALISIGLVYTQRKKKYMWNTVLLGLTMILIGYSSYATIMIRSSANPPMDQNNPENVFNLLSYLNREQYGDRPLFYGQYFNAPVEERKEGDPIYDQVDGRYEIVDYKADLKYDSRFTGFFPRMYSSQNQHVEDYKSWVDIEGRKVSVRNNQGKTVQRTVPSVGSNLAFFFKYQVGHMYLRYFMWNFSGRQNDIQGHGNVRDGNWISGLSFIDDKRLGDQESLPDHLKNNPARNAYYMLPFLLGIIGALYQLKKEKKDFVVVLMLFILTGVAIVYYLNQYPHQPRERDYAYAGSFYAFSIWIGFSVLAISQYLRKIFKPMGGSILTALILLIVPLQMASENWDDHDRSGRYTTRDFASNYLNSCRPNAILFTNGDNDTFPLWYAQEVEGIRTDVRVANFSYLRAGWYVEQMMRKAYESEPFPMTHTVDQMKRGVRDVVPISNQIKDRVSVKKVINFVASEDERTRIPSPFDRNKKVNYIPTKNYKLEIDSSDIISKGVIGEEYHSRIENQLSWSIGRNYLLKDGLTVMDLMASFDWNRPIHFAITVGSNKHFNLSDYMLVEGLSYYLSPVKAREEGQIGEVNTDRMYDIMMNKFKWGGIEDTDIYLDEDNRRMLANFRNSYSRLARSLIREEKNDSARKVMDYCMNKITNEKISYGFAMVTYVDNYFRIGDTEKAKEYMKVLRENLNQEMDYYTGLGEFTPQFTDDIRRNMYVIRRLSEIAQRFGEEELYKEIVDDFNRHVDNLEQSSKILN